MSPAIYLQVCRSMRLAALLLPFFYGLKGFRALWTLSGGRRCPPSRSIPRLTRLERVFLRDGSFGDAEGEDGKAAARLIEVRLSPACETKVDGFRSASPEVEGGGRAQLERGGGGAVVGGKLKRTGAKTNNTNQVRVKSQRSGGF